MTLAIDGKTVVRSSDRDGLSRSSSSAECSGYARDDNAPNASGFLVSDPGWSFKLVVADGRTRPTGDFAMEKDAAPYAVGLTDCANPDGCGLFSDYYFDDIAGAITITTSTDRLVGGGYFIATCHSGLLNSCPAKKTVQAAVSFDLDASDCD